MKLRKSVVFISESEKSEPRGSRKSWRTGVLLVLHSLHHWRWRLVLVVRGLGGSVYQSDQAGGGLTVGGELCVVRNINILISR